MNPSILGKLESLAERHNEVSALLADADTIANQDRYRQLSMEYAQLTPVVNNFRDWQQAQDDINSAEGMLKDPDPDMQAMAQEELSGATARAGELELELQKLLLPKDPYDNSNIFLDPQVADRDPQRKRRRARRLQGTHCAHHRPWRLFAPEVRVRRPPRAAGTGDGIAGSHPHLRGHCRHPAGGG
jgi:hypothetical protein